MLEHATWAGTMIDCVSYIARYIFECKLYGEGFMVNLTSKNYLQEVTDIDRWLLQKF